MEQKKELELKKRKEERYIEDYFAFDSELKWKKQDYIKNLTKGQLFKLYINKKVDHYDLTVRRYLHEQSLAKNKTIKRVPKEG